MQPGCISCQLPASEHRRAAPELTAAEHCILAPYSLQSDTIDKVNRLQVTALGPTAVSCLALWLGREHQCMEQ